LLDKTNSPDLNPVDYAVSGALQQRVYHGRKFKTVEELKQTILSLNGKTYRNVSLTVVSMNGVVVLNVLSRMAVGISNIAISLSNSLGCATGFYFVVVD